jgi:SprT-like family
MARPNPIRSIMAHPLPSITYQRRKQFRPNALDVIYAYDVINKYVFDGVLVRPDIHLKQLQKCWGLCSWHLKESNGTSVSIALNNKWFCQQWFMNTLAHEMVHQYQWDVYRWDHLSYYGKEMNTNSGGHGPSFYAFRNRFEHYDLNLKISFGQKRWFKHQDFAKC